MRPSFKAEVIRFYTYGSCKQCTHPEKHKRRPKE